MGFSEIERQKLLSLKGVGATVILRLEQAGFSSLADLQRCSAEDITQQISAMLRSTCWHNSPQARSAIQAVIELANQS
jgi:nucleotidyltransferase/DNA polymerase involved in DNA repair